MKYTAVLKNGEKTRRLTVEAENAREVFLMIRELISDKGIKITAYPVISDEHGRPYVDGIIAGAWEVCKNVVSFIISKEGFDHQWALFNDIINKKVDTPAEDCHQEAELALLEAIEKDIPIEDQYNEAYNAVNRWLYHNHYRNWKHRKDANSVSIDDMNEHMTIVELSPGMFSIVKSDSSYIPLPQEITVVRDMQRIAMILQTLNDLTEKQMQLVNNIVSRDMSINGAAREANIPMSSAYSRIIKARRKALVNKRLYAQHKISKRELQQLFNSLSPLAREVALDVLQGSVY